MRRHYPRFFWGEAKEQLSLYLEHADRKSPTYREVLKLAAYLNDKHDLDSILKDEIFNSANRTYTADQLALAKYYLGMWYLGDRKADEGEKWLTLSAKEGDFLAATILGHLSFVGGDGIPKSMNKGKQLMEGYDAHDFDFSSDGRSAYSFYLYFVSPPDWEVELARLAQVSGSWAAKKLCEFLGVRRVYEERTRKYYWFISSKNESYLFD